MVAERVRFVPVVPTLEDMADEVGHRLKKYRGQPIGLIITPIILGALREFGVAESDLDFYRKEVHRRVSSRGGRAKKQKPPLVSGKRRTRKRVFAEAFIQDRAKDLAEVLAARDIEEQVMAWRAANYHICPVEGFPVLHTGYD